MLTTGFEYVTPVTWKVVLSSLFTLASSLFKSFQCLISAQTQGDKCGHLFTLTCSTVLWGHKDICKQILLVCVVNAHSVWTTEGLPHLTACVFRVYTAQVPGCSVGHCPKQARYFMHFPGLSHSGLGSWVRWKCTDLVGHAFCALSRSKHLRQLGA